MDRKLVPLTALVATTLLFNQRPTVDEHMTRAEQPAVAAVATNQHTNSAPGSATASTSKAECALGVHCDALVPLHDTGPWVASCAWFQTYAMPSPPRGESIELEGNESEQLGRNERDWCLDKKSTSAHLQFLIVTIPDPTTTHLALYFDRSIEAVERAVNFFDLYLTRYWLPWSVQGEAEAGGNTSEDLRVNKILRDFRSTQPGVLIFTGRGDDQRGERVTFVFLVGESPTSGINKSQFEKAAYYVDRLCKAIAPEHCDANQPEKTVGPFFSGSVPSAIDLKDDLAAQNPHIAMDFLSGSMSSWKQVQTLLHNGFWSFEDTQQGDEYAEAFLLEFLHDQGLTQDGRNVAFLEENETRYGTLGRALLKGCPEWTNAARLKFPRELTRLRNASASSLVRPVTVPGENLTPVQGLSWNWSDPGKGEDRVPSFSGGQEPLSVQAVLESIAQAIRQQNIQYVGIVATDVFDMLYLSRFLKMSVPNTRLFVLDSDLLMVNSGAEGRELDGTLVVTPYPLMARSDSWAEKFGGTGVPLPAAEELPSRSTQGLYNAAYLQLIRGGARVSEGTAEPASSGSREGRPLPVWITMVGRAGFWPVSLWHSSASENKPACQTDTPPARPDAGTRLTFDPPDAATTLLEGALLLWGILHLLGMWSGWAPRYSWLSGRDTRFSWINQFRVRPAKDRRRHAQYQTYYLMCATLALSAMLALTVISSACLWMRGAVDRDLMSPSPLTDFFRAAVTLALLGMAASIARRIDSRLVRPRPVRYLPWLIYVLAVGGWIWLSIRPDATGIFFTQRAFYLGDGVSPLLPVEFLILIYYAWSWTFIRKVRLSESKQILVPELEHLGLEGQGFANCCAALKKATDRLVFDPGITKWTLLSFAAIIMVLIRPWTALRSVEGSFYDGGFILLFLYICALIVLVWGRYMYIWSILSRILRGLERTDLRRAFSRLPESLYSWSPLWYENAQRRAHTISSRSIECFRAIVNRGGYGRDGRERLTDMTKAFFGVVCLDNTSSTSGPDAAKGDARCNAARRLQRLFLDTSIRLLQGDLKTYWNEGGSDTLDEEAQATHPPKESNSDTQLRYLEEEFIALRYVGLIHYESAQLKNLVVLLVTSFVLALISIGSYPFLAGRMFVWTIAGVFVVFGAGIIVSFAQMSRDAILSRLSGTDAGKLDLSFYLRVLSFGALPLLALLASQFPSAGRELTSWLEPALNAMH